MSWRAEEYDKWGKEIKEKIACYYPRPHWMGTSFSETTGTDYGASLRVISWLQWRFLQCRNCYEGSPVRANWENDAANYAQPILLAIFLDQGIVSFPALAAILPCSSTQRLHHHKLSTWYKLSQPPDILQGKKMHINENNTQRAGQWNVEIY